MTLGEKVQIIRLVSYLSLNDDISRIVEAIPMRMSGTQESIKDELSDYKIQLKQAEKNFRDVKE